MVNNFHTLRALAREWDSDLRGSVLLELWTQNRGELSVLMSKGGAYRTLHLLTRPPAIGTFVSAGSSKAKRNAANVLGAARGRRVVAVRTAERDRVLFFDLGGGWRLQVALFGSGANAFAVGPDGLVSEAFRRGAKWRGKVPPAPRAAPEVETPEAFLARWRPETRGVVRALQGAMPLFDRTLAAEAVFRAGSHRPTDLFAAALQLRAELESPDPHVYDAGGDLHFGLFPLLHLRSAHAERFETVDQAAKVFMQRTLGRRRLRAEREPLGKALAKALDDTARSLLRMRAQRSKSLPSTTYERFGHLLMASQAHVPSRAESVTLPDLFAAGAPVTIPLDPSKSAVQNAERHYGKARGAREGRRSLERRIDGAEKRQRELASIVERFRAANTRAAFDAFRREERDALERVLPRSGGRAALPFRRFTLAGRYHVWAGRNARESDELTLRGARRYDLWMHARGVAGSHVVLRLPNRSDRPARAVVEAAAAIAAHFSKARGSALVPVIVTPRKFVRKPKGAAPGAVTVEREEVLLVKPALPQRRVA